VAIKLLTQKEIDSYVDQWSNYLSEKWGVDRQFSVSAATVFIYCSLYGLRPVITSGYRSPERQAELVAAEKAGNPNVHTPLPPGKSLHNNRNWLGQPASLAIDMVTNNPKTAGIIAKHFGVVWGGLRDEVHFAARGGML
jgi:hypothetical protein